VSKCCLNTDYTILNAVLGVSVVNGILALCHSYMVTGAQVVEITFILYEE
jgi:hypothetical protein